MKKTIFFNFILLLLILSSCKTAVNYTAGNTGTYSATGIYTNYNKALVTAIDEKTVEIQLTTSSNDTYVTIAGAKLSSATQFTVSEDVTLKNTTGVYTLEGSGTFGTNTIAMNLTAKNKADNSVVVLIPFSGSK
ncbi:MAG: hypothetical protein U0T84_05555 [Chitinophagales bacterium]